MELKRYPGTCCQEPTCDNKPVDMCESCGHLCSKCCRDLIRFFDEAKRYIIAVGYGYEIEWCQNLRFESQTADTFIREYTWVVLCSGFREKPAREIQKKFWYAIESHAPLPFEMIRHPAKREVIMKVMADYEKCFQDLQASPDKLHYIQTLPYMGGDALGYQLARNLGLDFVKPDRHMRRLAAKWDTDPDSMCRYIQKFRPELRLGTIDVILWRNANLRG
jgi:hypothetical protein